MSSAEQGTALQIRDLEAAGCDRNPHARGGAPWLTRNIPGPAYALTLVGAVVQRYGLSGTNVVARITTEAIPRDGSTFDHAADRQMVRQS